MHHALFPLLLSLSLLLCPSLRAGIFIRDFQPVPVTGYINFLDQLSDLRGLAPTDINLGGKDSKGRAELLAKITALKAREKELNADELADLGGMLIYIKTTAMKIPAFAEAEQVLEAAYRKHPRHYGINSNLGTLYILTGKYDIAERCMETAAASAPDNLRTSERLLLRLTQRRSRERLSMGMVPIDDLFGPPSAPLRYLSETGKWEAGLLAAKEVAKLPQSNPAEAIKLIQQLLLWMPDDARLLWQFGELAAVMGDKKAAYKAFDICVGNFRMSHPDLKQKRVILQQWQVWFDFTSARFKKIEDAGPVLARVVGQNFASIGNTGYQSIITSVADLVPATSVEDLLAKFNNPGGEAAFNPNEIGQVFEFKPWYWIPISIGTIIILLLLVMQVKGSLKRLRSDG